MADTNDPLDPSLQGTYAKFSGRIPPSDPPKLIRPSKPQRKRGKVPFLLIGIAVLIVVVIIGRQLEPDNPAHVPNPVPAGGLFVIRLGNSSDSYFDGMGAANNSLGVEMKWTTKAAAKRFTSDEAKRIAERMQGIAQQGGFNVPLRIEPAE